MGGDLSWYGTARVWALRLALGRLFGEKLEIRRPERLEPGAAADWWEVVRADRDHLVLASFGWFCGDGWLGWRVNEAPWQVEQVAAFRPKGLLGLAYWWALWPVHQVVFRIMMRDRVQRTRWVRPNRWARRRTGSGAAPAARNPNPVESTSAS